jgi:diguanylate cyclase (GGDEF)-like protein/PAS domain S-box-containing protein
VVRRQPLWIVVIIGFAAAALSATTILKLQDTALVETGELGTLGQLHVQAYRMFSVTEEMRVEGTTDHLRNEYLAADAEFVAILEGLGTHVVAGELDNVTNSYEAFTSAMGIQIDLLSKGVPPVSVHESVDATFAGLSESLGTLQVRAQAEALASSGQAALGTVLALLFSATAITLLVARFERIRRQRDIAERHALREREATTRSLIENSSDLVLVVDRDEQLRFASSASRRVLDIEPADLVGRALDTLVHPDDEGALRRAVADVVREPQASPFVEVRFRRGDAEWQYTEVALANLLDDRSVRGIVMNARDVTDRRALERRLAHQALHDPLTGLANRRLFLQRLDRLIADHAPAAVIFLDLDGFKALNDSLGHAGGDSLLVALAERLQTMLPPGDTMARFGGDEFAVLIEGARHAETAAVVARRLVDALAQPFDVFESEVFIGASFGIAVATVGQSAESLVGSADIAMYAAKSRGTGQVEIFEPTMRATAIARSEIALELRGAVERSEFAVRYQPIMDLALGTVAGFEALVRWEHPTRGEIAPDRFIPSAEQNGLIIPIGRFVLREACAQALTWPDDLFLSVNLSTRQLQDPALVADVRAVLQETGFAPHRLELEITETAAMDDEHLAAERLAELKALGVRLAIDDFGVGYSSLGYLRRFDVDVLKLDRSFIQGITISGRELAFATSIVELSKLLGVQTVAEGVESAEQVRKLREIGCDLAQGYYFSRPLKVVAVREFLDRLATEPTGAAA